MKVQVDDRMLRWPRQTNVDYEKELAWYQICAHLERCIRPNYIEKDKVDQKFSLFQPGFSSTGWLCWCKDWQKSDIEKEVGIGVSFYFKTMKQLFLLFILCSILSIPQYFFLYKSDKSVTFHSGPEFGFDAMLGNLGWNKYIYSKQTNATTDDEGYPVY